MSESKDIYSVRNGRLEVCLHAGQLEAYNATERIILILAGTQSGKTSFGPIWLYREIGLKGPGDYGVASPTFPLMELKAIPEFRRFFEETLKLGKYYQAPIRRFVFSRDGLIKTFGNADRPCTVYFGYAENPDSLESSTYKAVWCDEAGQKKFKLDSWDALQRRLAIHEGRSLLTTTPYEFGWLKSRIFDRCQKGDTSIRVVRFESIMNPAFPVAEFERQREILPAWKFAMMYQAIWTKPAGTIYDVFDPAKHCCQPFAIPQDWVRFLGVDFGQVNTAGVYAAISPKTQKIYIYRTYHTGGKSAAQHVNSLLDREPEPPYAVGGAPSEEEWREKFSSEGLPVSQPLISEVEPGIDAVYEAIKSGRLVIFGNLDRLIRDLYGYSRVLDENGEPTEAIEDKHSFHRLDALRYVVSEIMRGTTSAPAVIQTFPTGYEHETPSLSFAA